MSEHGKSDQSSRRDFLTRMTTGAAVVAGTTSFATLPEALAPGMKAVAAPPFDDSWTQRVASAKYHAVFDAAEVGEGTALTHVTSYLNGFKEQLGVSGPDIVPVLVMRHQATWMAFNDAMWTKYEMGQRASVKDPSTGNDALRNPFAHVEAGDKKAYIATEASLESLRASGVVLLACNRAAMRFVGMLAQRMNLDPEVVRADLRANLVPGVLLQPSGIYAVHRAQTVGCTFIKST